MSVQTEIDRISAAVQNAHLKVIEKGGTTAAPYLVGNLASAIDTIPEATEPTLQSKTVSPATSAQTVKPDSGYDGLSQVTVNAMPTATQATPSISVDSAGKITASATQTAGYVAAGTKSATKQLTAQAAQTITPGTADKTIASGRYLTGTQTIKGDANLVADNIKSGVSIFGVAGSFEGSGEGSSGGSVETCTIVFDSKYGDALNVQPLCMTLFENGQMKIYMETGWSLADKTVNNVVCGSPIVLAGVTNIKSWSKGTSTGGYDVSGGVEVVSVNQSGKYLVFKAPTTAGATGTIWFNVA